MSDGVFTMDEYMADVRGVVAYAEKHGAAIVLGDDGEVQFRINIPTEPLPIFGDPCRKCGYHVSIDGDTTSEGHTVTDKPKVSDDSIPLAKYLRAIDALERLMDYVAANVSTEDLQADVAYECKTVMSDAAASGHVQAPRSGTRWSFLEVDP